MPIRDYTRRPVRDLSSLDKLSGLANQFVDLSFRNDLEEQRMQKEANRRANAMRLIGELQSKTANPENDYQTNNRLIGEYNTRLPIETGFEGKFKEESAPKVPPKKYYYSGLDENKKPRMIKNEQGIFSVEQYGYHDPEANQFVPLPNGERTRLIVNAETSKRADESLNLAKQRLAEARTRADNNDFKFWLTNKRMLETQLINLGAQVTKYQQLANTSKDDASKAIFENLADDYATSVTELQQSYDFINDMANKSVGNPPKAESPKPSGKPAW